MLCIYKIHIRCMLEMIKNALPRNTITRSKCRSPTIAIYWSLAAPNGIGGKSC